MTTKSHLTQTESVIFVVVSDLKLHNWSHKAKHMCLLFAPKYLWSLYFIVNEQVPPCVWACKNYLSKTKVVLQPEGFLLCLKGSQTKKGLESLQSTTTTDRMWWATALMLAPLNTLKSEDCWIRCFILTEYQFSVCSI